MVTLVLTEDEVTFFLDNLAGVIESGSFIYGEEDLDPMHAIQIKDRVDKAQNLHNKISQQVSGN